MPESYDTVVSAASDEFIERRSTFIGEITPVLTEAEAQTFISEKRAQYHDATHNCYAYILRDGNIQRYSDDGEPQGTAGIPILEVIKREKLLNIAVVVTRYFGGILLGAGGLVRAYTHAAKLTVDAAERVTMCQCALFMFECPYHLYERMELLLTKYGAKVLDKSFGSDITFFVRIKKELLEPCALEISEMSNGHINLEEMGEEFSQI